MNKILLILALVSNLALASGAGIITFSGGSPSVTSYSATNSQSKGGVCSGNTVTVFNQTDALVGVAFGTTSSAPSTDIYYVPPGPNSGIEKRPESALGSQNYIFFRSPSGAETSGSVQYSCTTEAQ